MTHLLRPLGAQASKVAHSLCLCKVRLPVPSLCRCDVGHICGVLLSKGGASELVFGNLGRKVHSVVGHMAYGVRVLVPVCTSVLRGEHIYTAEVLCSFLVYCC